VSRGGELGGKLSSGREKADVKPLDHDQLQVITPAPRREWLSLLDRDTHATIYQTPEWLDAICRSEGYEDASRLYETAAGRQFVLPVVRRRMCGALSIEESMPSAWGMGGLLAAEPIDADDLGLIWSDLQSNANARLRVRDSNLGRGLPVNGHHLEPIAVIWETKHVLDVREGFDAVYSKSFHRSAKKGIRKAERAGVAVECDSSGRLVPVYYDLYTRWVARSAAERNLPTSLMLHRARSRESLRKFQVMAKLLGTSSKIWVAWFKGEPIAATISLSYKSRAFAFRGHGDKELANSLHANDLLHCYRIEDACRAGCTSYNMGGSGGIPSLMAYKAKFGAVAMEFPVYTIESFPLRQISRSLEGLNSATRALAGRWRQPTAPGSDAE
jgi:Acetyltransferase (GNAT) domain